MSDKQNEFVRRISINKEISTVFEAWAVQGGMEEWMLQSAVFLRNDVALSNGAMIQKGDECQWTWHGWPEHTHQGLVTKVEKNNLFSFTFDPAGHVDVHFEPKGNNRTEIVLRQTEVPIDGVNWHQYFYGCSLGWSFWLVNLKAWLEHGISLDERSVTYEGETKYQVVNQ